MSYTHIWYMHIFSMRLNVSGQVPEPKWDLLVHEGDGVYTIVQVFFLSKSILLEHELSIWPEEIDVFFMTCIYPKQCLWTTTLQATTHRI